MVVIAKSDLIILVVSVSALVVGIARWQINTATPTQVAGPAPAPADPPAARAPAGPGGQPALNATPLDPDTERQPGTATLPSTASTTPERIDPLNGAPARSPSDGGTTGIARPAGNASASSGQPLYRVYEVVSGDSLSLIAQRLGTSVATLSAINELNTTVIQVGQRLRYPQAAN